MKIELNNIYNMDCLLGMREIPDKSVDAVICDLPYGTTSCSWDSVIPFEPLWEQYRRICKPEAAIVLFATQPFTTSLISSNMRDYRYSWVWMKDSPNGFLNANYAPLKITEDICVFSPAGTVGSLSKVHLAYHPQGLITVNRMKRNRPNSTYRASQGYSVGGNKLNSDQEYIQKFTGYPHNVLKFPRDKGNLHPTQKPLDLLRYLVLTYTDVGGVILDNTCGSGTTCIAAILEHRNYIGFELDRNYYDIARQRIAEVKRKPMLF